MKRLALGLSTATFVLLSASGSVAQNAGPSPTPAEATPPPPTPSAEAPVAPPVAPPNPAPPNLAPTADSTPKPAAPYPQYPYPYQSYGYPNPYGGYGWGMPNERPKELAYTGGGIPHGYKLEEKYNLGLLIAGPTLFALAYVITVGTAVERVSDEPPSIGGGSSSKPAPWNTLFVPLTGPFAFAAHAPSGTAFIYATEGLGQAVGLGLFLLGILRPKNILVRKEVNEAFHPTLRVGPRQMQLEMRF